MEFVSHYECTLCHQTYPKDIDFLTCKTCGETGILDIMYDYEKMSAVVTRDYFNNCNDKSILRYQPLMSINPTNKETLLVGNTPLYKSTTLAKKMGLSSLYIKDDSLNPTASLKDRASLVACLKAIEAGQDTICCSSTGNAASSLAGNAAKLGLNTLIFVPERAPIGKLTQMVLYGSNVVKVKGDYKAAFNASKKAIDAYHLYNRNAAINPHLVEGKKTVVYEICEQLDFKAVDYCIVSVGDGCTIAGVYKGFYDLKQLGLIPKIPMIIGVQSAGCNPFVKAFKTNSPLQETEENTIADSIAVGLPRNPVKGMNAVRKSNGFYMDVRDQEILDAINMLAQNEGVFAEPAGATAFAGLYKLMKESPLPASSTIVVLVTGNGLKDTNSVSTIVESQLITFDSSKNHHVFNQNSVDEFMTEIKKRGESHE